MFLENGAIITPRVKKLLIENGERFEFYRDRYNPEFLERDSLAMDKLYDLIGVKPPMRLEKHDGISLIITKGDNISEQYNYLWNYLVPASGIAKTAQGEVLRIAGKVAHEIMDNGGMNWDGEFKKMLDIFWHYFELGNGLSEEKIEDIKKIIKKIYNGSYSEEPEKLMNYAVEWIVQNQKVISIIPPTYTR